MGGKGEVGLMARPRRAKWVDFCSFRRDRCKICKVQTLGPFRSAAPLLLTNAQVPRPFSHRIPSVTQARVQKNSPGSRASTENSASTFASHTCATISTPTIDSDLLFQSTRCKNSSRGARRRSFIAAALLVLASARISVGNVSDRQPEKRRRLGTDVGQPWRKDESELVRLCGRITCRYDIEVKHLRLRVPEKAS